MLVLVTGGTGFIGGHTVAAVTRTGHRVRLLVRRRDRVDRALRPHGVDLSMVEVVDGDVTDVAAVETAVRGCTAVVHAASAYSFDSRAHPTIRRVNARGTEVVLGAAVAAGVDPIVHVSTFGALRPAGEGPVTPSSALANPRETYLASKVDADRIARRHQDAGQPVVITYPSAALGPDDPHLGDQAARVRNVLRGLMPLWPDGGFPVGDVRDLADLHAALLEPGQGPRRFLGPGRYVPTREFLSTLRQVTGRRLPAVHLPARALLPVGALVSLAQRASPVHLPAEYGALYICATASRISTDATDDLLGRPARPLHVTMADTVRWLAAAGHVSRGKAGAAALPASAPR